MTSTVTLLPTGQSSDIKLMNALRSEESRRPVIRSAPFREEGNSFFDAFGAALWRENTILSAWHEITDGDDKRSVEEVVGYNPYRALKTTYDPETLATLSGAISSGEFDTVRSDAQLKATVDDILFEQDIQRRMANDGVGYLFGSLFAAVVDPTSYIPFVGAGAKVGRAGKIGLGMLNAALGASASEGVLQMTQRDRGFDETLMNIGTAGVIGGGFGVFSHALNPNSALHPHNVNNPLRRENLRANGEITRDLHGAADELTAAEIEELRTAYVSAGAAAARDAAPRIARSEPKGPVGKAVRAVGDFVNSKTIKGQVLRSHSDAARWLGVRLFDPAGILMEGNLKGVPNARSATILKQSYMAEYEELVGRMQASVRQLSADMERKVDFKDVLLLTQRHLYAMLDERTVNSLRAKYGDKFDLVNQQAQNFAETVHGYNAKWEQRLIEADVLADPKRVAQLSAEVKSLRDQIAALKPMAGVDDAAEVVEDAAREAQLKELRDQRDDLIEQLRIERQKGTPLGRDYGHAQMWNRDAIFQSPARFKAWLHDVFAFTPDEQWLIETHHMTLDEFEQLPPDKARAIREDWAGDEHEWKIEALEHQLTGQKQLLKQQRLDLEEAFRWLGALEKRETNLTLSEARKKRDAVWAKVAATKDPELKARAEKMDALFRKVEATHDDITTSRRLLDEGIADAKKAKAETAKAAGKTEKALRSVRKETPLNQMVEEVYETISARGRVPHGIIQTIMERSDRTTGRVKERALSLNREQRIQAVQEGWLRDDLSSILLAQTDQLASELSLREAIGIGRGKQFSSWDDALSAVERDYQDLIESASDQAVKTKLHAEMDRTIRNLIEARDRHRGGNFVDDGTSSGWLGWSSRKMRQANLIRYGSGFLLSSLTDTGTVALRHGSLTGLLARHGARAVKIMQKAANEDMSHFKAMIASIEIGMGAHASAKRFGTEDVMHGVMYGYGMGTGATRKITAKIDKATEVMSEIGIKMGGLPLWNTFWKTVAGLDMLDRLRSMTARYSDLTPAEIADLATLGIGKSEAERIAKFIEKHGEVDTNGTFDPHFELWEGPAGREAARDAELAIMRDMNRSINTPDIGDTPRLMTTLHGQMLLTFQTFTFTFLNQYVYPLVQRMSLFREKQAYMSLGILLGGAMMVMIGKDIIGGRDPMERLSREKLGQTMYELVDRSGLLGWTSPYIDSGLKLTSGFTGFGGGARYVRNGWLESLLGINMALVSDVERAGSALMDPDDPDKIRKLMTIAPFASQARLLGRLLEQ